MSDDSEWNRIREANRVRREREAEDRTAIQRELEQNATPETLRHRQANVIDELTVREKLTIEQRRAAREIDMIFTAITSGLQASIAHYGERTSGGSFLDWRAGLIRGYHERYVPWRDEAGKAVLKGRTIFDLVLALAVQNYGVRQLAIRWQMDQRRVLDLARVSLHRYAQIGGWVDEQGQPTLGSS